MFSFWRKLNQKAVFCVSCVYFFFVFFGVKHRNPYDESIDKGHVIGLLSIELRDFFTAAVLSYRWEWHNYIVAISRRFDGVNLSHITGLIEVIKVSQMP